MDFIMDPNNEYQLLQNQSQVVAPYQQLQFTTVPAQTFNYPHSYTIYQPQTSTNQTFTNYNNATYWQSSATATSASPLLMALLLQKDPSVVTELSEAKQEILNAKQKVVKLVSEKNTILEEKVKVLEDMKIKKGKEIFYSEIHYSLELGRKKSKDWVAKKLETQLEKLQEQFDFESKENEFLNQSNEKNKMEKFRIARIRSIYPNAVDPFGERMQHYVRPLTKAEEEKILAQIEAEEKAASSKKEASEVSASSSIKTYPSSSSSSSPVRLEAIGKDNQKHGICPNSRGSDQMCLCGGRFSQRGNLIRHILQRTKGGGQFSCSVCEKRFDGTGSLKTHVKRVHKHNLRFFVGCRLCGLSFGSYSQLYEHRTFEHGTTKSACKAKVSKNPRGKPATEPKHSFKGTKENFEGDKKIFLCRCGKEFSEMKLLNYHTKMMENGKIFSCNMCESRFATVELLKSHYKRKHKVTPISSYECRDCGEVFSSFSELHYHKVDTHQG